MEDGTRRLMPGLLKQTQFCMSFIALWSQNRSFQEEEEEVLHKRRDGRKYYISVEMNVTNCVLDLSSYI